MNLSVPDRARVFPRLCATATWILALSLLAACGSSASKVSSGPCARGELTGCGTVCSASAPCNVGLYCAATGSCQAECSTMTAQHDCGPAETCGPDGRCIANVDAGQVGDDASVTGNFTRSTGEAIASGEDGGVCGSVEVGAATVMPNVILIVDQSGSMTQPFGTSTRWDALKTALLANDGLIAELEDRVNFGLALYSSSNDATHFPQYLDVCPVVTAVPVAQNNLTAIRAVYQPAGVIDDTPTGEAVQKVLSTVQVVDAAPTIFVLATDGEPDTCANKDPVTDQDKNAAKTMAIQAVQDAYKQGVKTYLIAVAENSDVGISDGHAQDLANAGVGLSQPAAGQQAPFYRVTDTTGLRDSLRTIVGGVLSCDLALSGSVTIAASDVCAHADVQVELNGKPLVCGDADGWELKDATHISVKGAACDTLKHGNVAFKARFPCDVVIY